jgi:hypothetical protein
LSVKISYSGQGCGGFEIFGSNCLRKLQNKTNGKGKEKKGEERKGKERKGKERKEKNDNEKMKK